MVVNVADFGMNMQEAVDAGRFHHQWLPDIVYFESTLPDSITVRKLELMGHVLKARGPIGSVNAIMKLRDGSLQGGADRRGDNSAAGY
jgi:gamma-glutamyltranspeptidase/glutathione hydrolase